MSLPIAYFSRRYRISASHRLSVAAFSEEQNRETFGKCANPYGHGHNYFIEVTIRGPVDPTTGMVIDLIALDGLVREAVADRFDHTHLNVDPIFADGLVPSTENFAVQAEQILQPAVVLLANKLKGAFRLHSVRIEETSNNAFDYLSKPDLADVFKT